MKQDTAILFLKGACYTVIGGLTPLVSSLAQWANDGSWPKGINWIVIVAGAVTGAATQLLSFLSSAYSDYQKSRSGTSFIERHKP